MRLHNTVGQCFKLLEGGGGGGGEGGISRMCLKPCLPLVEKKHRDIFLT